MTTKDRDAAAVIAESIAEADAIVIGEAIAAIVAAVAPASVAGAPTPSASCAARRAW